MSNDASPDTVTMARPLDRVAPSEIAVLITVGKEVFAERLHAKSQRARKPLLRLNCGGITRPRS